MIFLLFLFFFFQAEDGIRDTSVTGVQTCALPIYDTLQSAAMTARRWLTLIVCIAIAHGLFFIWYQRPDWHTQWLDQVGYRRLGQVRSEERRVGKEWGCRGGRGCVKEKGVEVIDMA